MESLITNYTYVISNVKGVIECG